MKQSSVKEFYSPKTLAEAFEAYEKAEGKVCYVAGATDMFAEDNLSIETLVDITNLGLDYIIEENGVIRIGSCVTFSQAIKSNIIKEKFTALYDSSKVLADMTIRNVATYGGNIATALPSGDAIPSVYASGADIVLVSKDGERIVKAGEFFTGPRQTILKKGELIKEFVLNPMCADTNSGSAFEKVARNAVDIAVANVAAAVTVDKDNKVLDIKIALGAVGPTVMRAVNLEQSLVGTVLTEEFVANAAELVPEEISPISNIRSTAQYRNDVSKVLVKRAVMRAYNQAISTIK